MKALLTPSIEEKAIQLILKGMDPIEAVKKALIDETNMIGSLINSCNLSEKGQAVRDIMSERIYAAHNS